MNHELSELDVFFELFLPSLLETKHKEMRQYRHQVGLKIKGQSDQAWSLQGGRSPYIQRGLPKQPDLLVELSPNLVRDLVRGNEPDLQKALENQDIAMGGKEQALADLEFILG